MERRRTRASRSERSMNLDTATDDVACDVVRAGGVCQHCRTSADTRLLVPRVARQDGWDGRRIASPDEISRGLRSAVRPAHPTPASGRRASSRCPHVRSATDAPQRTAGNSETRQSDIAETAGLEVATVAVPCRFGSSSFVSVRLRSFVLNPLPPSPSSSRPPALDLPALDFRQLHAPYCPPTIIHPAQ